MANENVIPFPTGANAAWDALQDAQANLTEARLKILDLFTHAIESEDELSPWLITKVTNDLRDLGEALDRASRAVAQ